MNSDKANTIINNNIIAGRYLIASILLAIAGAVYEKASHGVYSYYMIYAFMIPLVLGCLPHIFDRRGIFETAGPAAEGLLAAAVTTLSVGSVVKGALDIYGTSNSMIVLYPVAGILAIAATLAVFVINLAMACRAE